MTAVTGAIWGFVRENDQFLLAALVLLVGVLVGHLLGRLSRRVLIALGMDDLVEGTPFERTANSLNTSTVALISGVFSWFVYGVSAVLFVRIIGLRGTDFLISVVGPYLPQVFVAIVALVVGIILADKSELFVAESLRGVKLPSVAILPRLVRYTLIFLTVLVVLAQLGVATAALLVLLAAYFGGLIVAGAVAFRDLLASGAAGTYLLLEQPYAIGDEVVIGDRRGVVQEIDAFVTHIEDDGQEYLVPNRIVFREGLTRVRDE